jgi:hypothetical protein
MQRRSILGLGLASAATLLLSGITAAHRPPNRSYRYTVFLEDEFGRRLRTFHHRGQTFVLGSYGDRFAVVVDNHTGNRVEAVVTVDGRDVVSGSPGDYARQRGYVLSPYGSVRITGFRQSLDRAAAFRFTSPADSYSSRRGTPENVGILGAAFFEEASPPPRPPRPIVRDDWDLERSPRRNPNPRSGEGASKSRSRSAAPSPRDEARSSRPGAPRNNLGTEYGESHRSRVYEVSFRRRRPTTPDSVLTLRYDDARGLEARGIDVAPWHDPPRYHRAPMAFPASRFAPPPR